MLLLKIKNDQLEARKQRNSVKASLLTTLFSECANIGINDGKRDTTDAEVLAIIKKFIENIDICLQNCSGESKARYLAEKEILDTYRPKQLSRDELVEIVKRVIEETKKDGIAQKSLTMKSLKENFAGMYDGKMASDLFDSLK